MRSPGQHAGLIGGRVVDGGHDLHQAVFHGDLDAQPAELAARLHLHVAVVLWREVARMRIERAQHAVDRGLHEGRVVGNLHIVGSNALEHVAEEVQLPVGVRGGRVGDPAHTHRHLRKGGHSGAPDERTNQQEGSFPNHPRTFSSSGRAHQAVGSIETPSFLNST